MKKILNILDKIFKALSSCVAPVVPILIGVGMLKVLLVILGPSLLNVLQESDSTYVVISFVADAGYYFLPIYMAVASAEYFKTNKYIAGLMGGMLLAPKFVELVNQGISLSFFKLPVIPVLYGNEMLPPIIIVFIEKYVYSFINKHTNEKIKDLIVPLLTILIMIPITLCIVGPVGISLGKGLTSLVLTLRTLGPIGNGIFSALAPFIVLFGLGGADLAVMLSIASSGPDPICFFGNVIYNSALGFATLGLYLHNKKSETLAASIAATVCGTSEPALFGEAIKNKYIFLSVIIGDFVGGLISGIFQVKSFTVASFGIFGVITTIGPGSTFIFAILSIIVACAISFSLSYFLNKKALN